MSYKKTVKRRANHQTPGRLMRNQNAARSALQKYSPLSLWMTSSAALSRPLHPRRTLAIAASVMREIFDTTSESTAEASPSIVSNLIRAFPVPFYYLDSETHEMLTEPIYSFKGKEYRVHPGTLSKPLEVLDKALRVSKIIDLTLVPSIGFGLEDLVELTLIHGDKILARTSQSFDKKLSPSEVENYWLDGLSDSVQGCSNPVQAQKALAWATTDQPPCWPVGMSETSDFSGFRVILPTGETADIPLFAYLDSLTCASRQLANQAVQIKPALEQDFSKLVKAEVQSCLATFGMVSTGISTTFVVELSPKRILHIDLKTKLAESSSDPKPIFVNPAADLTVFSTSAIDPPQIFETLTAKEEASLFVCSEYDLAIIAKTCLRSEDLHLMLEDLSKVQLNPVNDLGELWAAWRTAGHLPLRGVSEFFADPSVLDTWVYPPAIKQEPWLVHRALAHRVRDQIADEAQISAFYYEAEAAAKFQRDVHAPAAKRVAYKLINRYARSSLLKLAAQQLELSSQRRLENFGKVDVEFRTNERATVLALEMIASQANSASQKPDLLEWQEVLAAVEIWAEAEEDDMLSNKELKSLQITVDDLGNIDRSAGPGLVDLEKYFAALQAAPGESRPLPPLKGNELIGDLNLVHLPDSSAWEKAEEALEGKFGFAIAEIIHALKVLKNQKSSSFLSTELHEILISSGLTRESSITIIDFLTLDIKELAKQEVEPWKVTERKQRLQVRPLIPLGSSKDEVILLPHWTALCMLIIIAHLTEGRVPWSDEVCGKLAVDKLNAYRNELAVELEEQIRDCLQRLNWPHRINVKPPGGLIGIKSLKGEVDAIAIDAKAKLIWVLEVKDPAQTFSASRIHEGVLKFTRPKEYYDKMRGKENAIKEDEEAVLSSFNISPSEGWKVCSAVVTRRPVPAAFAIPPFPFFTPHDLEAGLLAAK